MALDWPVSLLDCESCNAVADGLGLEASLAMCEDGIRQVFAVELGKTANLVQTDATEGLLASNNMKTCN